MHRTAYSDALALETEDIVQMILREFGSHVVSAILFGSRVKGKARANSDYDILLIVDSLGLDPNDREQIVTSAVVEILLNSGTRISPIVLTKEEAEAEAKSGSPLFSSILSDYKVLYDPTKYGVQLLDLIKQSRSEMRYVERGRAWNLGQNRLNLARLYFRKAQADLESARHLSSVSQYGNTVFFAQQCGEGAAKATLALKNIELREHVVSGYLASELIAFAPEECQERLRGVVRMLVALEEHSIKPRYPFVTATRIWDPEKGYDKQAAEDAAQKAGSILRELEEFCETNLGYVPNDTD